MEHPTARLIMVMGLPGSGKTYFAEALGHAHGGRAFQQRPHPQGSHAGRCATRAADKARIYQDMFARVTEALEQGRYGDRGCHLLQGRYREPYLQWAAAHKVPVHLLYMEAAEAVIAERVGKKRPDSDADFAVYQKIKAEYEPIAEKLPRCCAPTRAARAERIGEALAYIAQHHRPDDPRADPRADGHGEFPEGNVPEKLVETHISWVLLCNAKVYKIKKAVKLSFLDFSTLEKRKHFVEQELHLNQRLAPAVYLRALSVVPARRPLPHRWLRKANWWTMRWR